MAFNPNEKPGRESIRMVELTVWHAITARYQKESVIIILIFLWIYFEEF